MSKRIYPNTGASFLSVAALAGDSTLTVVDGSSFPTPAAGEEYTVRIGGEYVLVTAKAGNVLTVARAQQGTTAAGYGVSTILFTCLTDEDLRRIARQSLNGVNQTSRREVDWNPGYGVTMGITDDSGNDKSVAAISAHPGLVKVVAPPTTGWSVANSATSFSYDVNTYKNCIVVKEEGATTISTRMLYRAAPATPYTIDIGFSCTPSTFNSNLLIGLGFYDTTDNMMHVISKRTADLTPELCLFRVAGTAIGANDVKKAFQESWMNYFRIGDDGTNLTFSFSSDGVFFQTAYSIARTSYMAAGPDQVGFFFDLESGTAPMTAYSVLYHWKQG